MCVYAEGLAKWDVQKWWFLVHSLRKYSQERLQKDSYCLLWFISGTICSPELCWAWLMFDLKANPFVPEDLPQFTGGFLLAEELQKNTRATRCPENAKCGAGGALQVAAWWSGEWSGNWQLGSAIPLERRDSVLNLSGEQKEGKPENPSWVEWEHIKSCRIPKEIDSLCSQMSTWIGVNQYKWHQ